MKKLIASLTILSFVFTGCASMYPSVKAAEIKAESEKREATAKREHEAKMAKLALTTELVKKGKDVPDSAVFRELNREDKATNEYDASIARSKAVASTVSAIVWPIAMVAGIKSIFGALAGIGKTEINADDQSSVSYGRDGSFNRDTGGDIRTNSHDITSTVETTTVDTNTNTESSNSQSNQSGNNN